LLSLPVDGALVAIRAGYTRARLVTRAARVADCMYLANADGNAAWVEDSLRRLLFESSDGVCRAISLGGGPAFDFVALSLLANVISQDYGVAKGPAVHATVVDYEEGWGHCAKVVATALAKCNESESRHTMDAFGRCDINKSLHDEVNTVVKEALRSSVDDSATIAVSAAPHIFVASYVVAENAAGLRKSNFRFFRDLMRTAAPGSLFVFTETTHRLWPELARVAFEEFVLRPVSGNGSPALSTSAKATRFQIALPQKIKHGSALLLGKPTELVAEPLSPFLRNETEGSSGEVNSQIDELVCNDRRQDQSSSTNTDGSTNSESVRDGTAAQDGILCDEIGEQIMALLPEPYQALMTRYQRDSESHARKAAKLARERQNLATVQASTAP